MEKKIKIKNRSSGSVAYTIPELGDARNVRREFAPKEIKEISTKELEALTFVGGGRTLLEDYLQILDDEGIAIANFTPEPEYKMSEEDIIKLIQTGSYDSFLDALDFAPAGVIDLIKHYAVSLPCNDNAKREAIKSKLGFDVDKALLIQKQANEDNEVEASTTKQRRVQIPTEEETPVRRTTYKVIG